MALLPYDQRDYGLIFFFSLSNSDSRAFVATLALLRRETVLVFFVGTFFMACSSRACVLVCAGRFSQDYGAPAIG
jgi:hypothetical protein